MNDLNIHILKIFPHKYFSQVPAIMSCSADSLMFYSLADVATLSIHTFAWGLDVSPPTPMPCTHQWPNYHQIVWVLPRPHLTRPVCSTWLPHSSLWKNFCLLLASAPSSAAVLPLTHFMEPSSFSCPCTCVIYISILSHYLSNWSWLIPPPLWLVLPKVALWPPLAMALWVRMERGYTYPVQSGGTSHLRLLNTWDVADELNF